MKDREELVEFMMDAIAAMSQRDLEKVEAAATARLYDAFYRPQVEEDLSDLGDSE